MVLHRLVSRGRKMSVLAGAHTPCTVPVAMMDVLFLAFQAPEPAR